MERSKNYLFLDTNVFLQYRDFDQIDWPKIIGTDAVCLVVPPEVLAELDKFTYDTLSERRKMRSRAITKKLSDILFSTDPEHEAPVPGRSNISLWGPADSADTSKYSGLVSTVSDDLIVAAILKFIEDNPKIGRFAVRFVSEDNGPLNKARARGIQIFRPDEKLRLADEPSQDQKKISILQRRLEEVESHRPKLELQFDDGGKLTSELYHQIQISRGLDDGEINKKLHNEATAIAWPQPEKPSPSRPSPIPASLLDQEASGAVAFRSIADSMSALTSALFLQVPNSEIERYRIESAEYLTLYKQYLLELNQFHRFSEGKRRIELLLANRGTSPATGVVVRVRFPDGIEIRESNPWSEEEPLPPERPIQPIKHSEFVAQSISQSRIGYSSISPLSHDSSPTVRDTLRPRLAPHDKTLVEWTRTKIMHNIDSHLTPIEIFFPESEGIVTYSIRYEIHAENMPHPAEGLLNIRVSTIQATVS